MGGVHTCTLTVRVTTAAGVVVTGTALVTAVDGIILSASVPLGAPIGATLALAGIPCPTLAPITLSLPGLGSVVITATEV
ncbi:hypothetical protein ACFX4N_29505 [Priestia sp. YIM B13551]|uniref:hypothetical protein n=1 Tax=Priestia sp. YIM B13551 TaxID=3366306 RepID=UPI00366C4680